MKKLSSLALACCLAFASLCISGCATHETYTPEKKEAQVTAPTLISDGVLKVGVNTSKMLPYAYSNNGTIEGIDVDCAAALADYLGLRLEIIDVGSSPVAKLNDKTVDIVMGIDETATNLDCFKSQAYMSSASILMANTASAQVPQTTSSARIATQSTSASSTLATKTFPQASILGQQYFDEIFSMLAQGNADYAAVDAGRALYSNLKSNTTAYIVALLEEPHGLSIGVSKTNSALSSVITNALFELNTNGVYDVIISKWLGSNPDFDAYTVIESKASSTATQSATASSSDTSTDDITEQSSSAEAGTDEQSATTEEDTSYATDTSSSSSSTSTTN